MGSVRVYIVLPDLSESKAEALCSLAGRWRPVDVLVSYTVLRWKPAVMPRLRRLKSEGCIGRVMIDSGAYHIMRLGEQVDPAGYAEYLGKHRGLADTVVAPDIPGSPGETLERTLEFMRHYQGSFIPVLQGGGISDYRACLEDMIDYGILERAPRLPDGRALIGIGGLDGAKKRVGFVSSLLESLPREGYAYHVFGVGVRVLRGLRRRGLLGNVYSVDSSGWLSEIMWRRRTVYRAETPVEANMHAIHGYLLKAEAAVAEA